MHWYKTASFYHIYPLGFCGCPVYNSYNEAEEHNILKILPQIDHIKFMGFSAVYFGPVFESVKHGYDTVDYEKIDRRLGTSADFKAVCDALHRNGMRVVLDGVFNHVGRDFWAFKDVRANGFASKYRDWFYISDGQSSYGDGFYYEGWEGHFELVKLNLRNTDVKQYLFSCIEKWVNEFQIDGIRLDVAYCLDHSFLRELRSLAERIGSDFWLMGETLHGDYNIWMNDHMLHSVTNYECYKGIHSSFNELNMFEIAYSMNRQFGSEHWTLYKGKHLYTFVDNHDVSRIATLIKRPEHLPLVYALLFTMPGIPSVYYGSEFCMTGDKKEGDESLRPAFDDIPKNHFNKWIGLLCKIHAEEKALCFGDYRQVHLTNRQFCFQRCYGEDRILIALNADAVSYSFEAGLTGTGTDLLTGKKLSFSGEISLEGYSVLIIKL